MGKREGRWGDEEGKKNRTEGREQEGEAWTILGRASTVNFMIVVTMGMGVVEII